MHKVRFEKSVALAALAALLVKCSGGLPDDGEGSGGASSGQGGRASGGELTGHGGTPSAAGDAGAAGMSEPLPTQGGSAGSSFDASGGIVGAAGESAQGGGAVAEAGAAGEASGGLFGAGGSGEPSGGTSASDGASQPGGSAGVSEQGGSAGASRPDGGAGAGGGGGNCAARQCDSSEDNDCSGTPDNQEPDCGCSVPNAQRACNTGKVGICASGMQQCQFAADKAHSAWSPCVGLSPQTRDCRSASDNNCNNIADNEEAECTACTVGVSRGCNAHPEDGKGLCRAGTQTCQLASDNASVTFGACGGDVGPTTEACGPYQADGITPTLDSNCNGLAGDGDYKLTAGCTTPVRIEGSTVKVFAGPHPGTVSLYACQSTCPVGTMPFSYYTLLSCGPDQGQLLGHVLSTPFPNYEPIKIPEKRCSFDQFGLRYDVQIPALTFYVLP